MINLSKWKVITILVKIWYPSVYLGWMYERKINRAKSSTAGITHFATTHLCKSDCSVPYRHKNQVT
jgi:hypothetical protein